MASGSSPLISAENLTFAYAPSAVPAVRAATFTVAPGERVAVIGASAAGKSTLGHLIAGLLPPTEGRVHFTRAKGTDAGRLNAAVVFQNPENQLVAATVEEDVAFGPENLGLDSGEIERRVHEALSALGIEHLRYRAVDALSGGEKQRVALSGALAMDPVCLVLDEATSMLHHRAKRQFEDAILAAQRTRGIAVLQITHDMTEAARADRVLVMHEGHVMRIAPPQEIFGDEPLLAGCGLLPPEVVLLHRALQRRGLGAPGFPLTESALTAGLLEVARG